jgi:hypothetical protein
VEAEAFPRRAEKKMVVLRAAQKAVEASLAAVDTGKSTVRREVGRPTWGFGNGKVKNSVWATW